MQLALFGHSHYIFQHTNSSFMTLYVCTLYMYGCLFIIPNQLLPIVNYVLAVSTYFASCCLHHVVPERVYGEREREGQSERDDTRKGLAQYIMP